MTKDIASKAPNAAPLSPSPPPTDNASNAHDAIPTRLFTFGNNLKTLNPSPQCMDNDLKWSVLPFSDTLIIRSTVYLLFIQANMKLEFWKKHCPHPQYNFH